MFRWAAPDRGRLAAGRALRPGSVLTDPPRPFPWLVALLALLLLGGAGLAGFDQLQRHQAGPSAAPDRLDEAGLFGSRGPACLRLVIGVDDSGSMRDFATARDAALSALFRWVPGRLRHDDEIAVLDFALQTAVRIPATPLASLGAVPAAPAVLDGQDTLVGPVAGALDAMAPTSCDVALVLLSDAQIADLPGDDTAGLRFQRAHGLHDIRLLAPGKSVQVPPQWSAAFPEAPPRYFDGLDEEATALAVAQTIADLTGQRLAS